eukprot:2732910-Amphidinium_carterae.1
METAWRGTCVSWQGRVLTSHCRRLASRCHAPRHESPGPDASTHAAAHCSGREADFVKTHDVLDVVMVSYHEDERYALPTHLTDALNLLDNELQHPRIKRKGGRYGASLLLHDRQLLFVMPTILKTRSTTEKAEGHAILSAR